MSEPIGTAVQASSGNVANAAAVATLPGVLNSTTYITGLVLTGGGATVGSLVVATVTGLLGGTLSYVFAVPTGAAIGAAPLVLDFSTPMPATGTNTPIVVTLPALGAGNTNAVANARGYRL